jgi:hypothetical protein
VIFIIYCLTTIGPAHHTYNIQLTKNNFNEKKLFQNSPVQPLTLEATGHRHRAIIHTVSPRRPPGSSVWAHTTKVVAVKLAPPKLAAKRHKMDPLLTSLMPQAL